MFFFGNTEATNASDYLTHLKAPTKFANGGFTLGGPIVRNKLFFFGDYQRTIDNFGYVVRATVPTMPMRNGDFSEVAQRIYDPSTGDVNGTGRVAFANNQIPQDRISPIATRLLALHSRAEHRRRALGQNNYQKAQTREKTTDGFDAKINYTLSEKDQMSYRVSFMRPVVFDPGLFGEYGGPANGGFAGTGTNTSISTRDHLDARLQRHDRARRARRPELLPQRHVDRGPRPDDEHRRRHPGRQPRRLHQRPLADQHRRLLRPAARASRRASRGTAPRRPGTSRRR